MSRRRNKNLHVVRDSEEQTDRLLRQIMTELDSEELSREEAEHQAKRRRKKRRGRAMAVIVTLLAAAVGIFLFIHLQTYTAILVSDTYTGTGTAGGTYAEFAGGILRYSRDGISYLNQKSEEQWNQPYQIKNPFIEANDTSAAVYDKGGNDIFVFQKDGIKGEIHTALPIQKMAVSGQGIVCVILKDESAPKIICYDTAGNILVEHKTSLAGTGYPVDVSISPDGEVMQVVYLHTQDGKIVSKLGYYNFGEEGKDKIDRQVVSKEYEGCVLAEGFFLSQNMSAAIGDNLIVIFKGKETPEETAAIKVEEKIKSVFHNDKYIGMILKKEGKSGYELRLYNAAGKQVLSKEFSGEYSHVKLCGSQVILYDGKKCSIFTRSGIQRFEGEMDHQILEIFPVAGVNKYIMINTDGMEHIRLVK